MNYSISYASFGEYLPETIYMRDFTLLMPIYVITIALYYLLS